MEELPKSVIQKLLTLPSRLGLIILIVLLSNSALCAQVRYPVDSLPVTYVAGRTNEKSRKMIERRIQIDIDGTGSSLKVTHLTTLPKKIRKTYLIQVTDEGRRSVVKNNRREIAKRIEGELLSLPWDYSTKRIDRDKFIKRFIAGNSGGKDYVDHWFTLMKDSSVVHGAQFGIKTGWFKKMELRTINLPVTSPVGFPSVDTNPCTPFDRFYERKNLLGYGLDKFRYRQFQPSNRKIERKNFTVYFKKNSLDVEAGSYQEILDFVNKNNLSILNARIEGFASVEGDSLNNQTLYRRRAKRLVSLLAKKNNEPINLDTVITKEAWDEFRELIRASKYKYLDTLTNAEFRQRVNSETELRENLEPFLALGRKANVEIATARRLTKEELLDNVRRELDRLGARLMPQRNRVRDFGNVDAEVMGVFAYFDKLVKDGNATYTDLGTMVDENLGHRQLTVLLFYHFLISVERTSNEMDSEPLDSLFAKRKWNNLFQVTNSDIISLIESDPNELQKIRLSQAVDIQYYTMKYIQKGMLDPDILCSFDYPMNRKFYGLKLQHYALLHELSKSEDLQCFQRSSKESSISIATTFTENDLGPYLQTKSISVSHLDYTEKKSYDVSPKGDYYFFIRTMLLSNDQSIRSFVSTSDNMIEFDLLYLLQLNVDAWNPYTNHFYDSLIGFDEMNKLIDRLRATDKRICDKTVNQLYLDYYMKTLLHVDVGLSNGSKQNIVAADNSLKYISTYYGDRSNLLFPALATYVIDALSSYYWLPTKKPSTYYANAMLQRLRLADPTGGLDARNTKYNTLFGNKYKFP